MNIEQFNENKKRNIENNLMTEYNIGKVDFIDYDIEVAESVGKALKEAVEDFPDLHINYIGSINTQVKGIRDVLVKHYINEINNMEDINWSEKEIEKIAIYNADDFIEYAGLNNIEGTIAWSLNIPEDINDELLKYNGIAINEKYASNNKAFKNLKINEVLTKNKPIGCDTPRSTVDHELGHEIDKLLGASEDSEIKKMFNEMLQCGKARDELSEYSEKNINEFIAECYSEYRNNPQPRKYAKNVYSRLIKMRKD